ncbi:MAG: L-lactate dehydrogenase, partial [Calditrichaeota bacterium]
ILHAVPFAHRAEVWNGSYRDLQDARVILITAGVNQKPGETRLQLLERNARVFEAIVPEAIRYAPDAIYLIATNPVDIMTHMTARIAEQHGIPKSRVFGTGTTLDTARFRALLGQKTGVDPQHIHAYVIGEHGDSEVLTWSLVTVGGMPLDKFMASRGQGFTEEDKKEIDQAVRYAAYRIIEGKGATYYGVGGAIARIIRAILNNQRAILTVCSEQDEVEGIRRVSLALPHLIGGEGILDVFHLPLSDDEREGLRQSAAIIKKATDELGI